MTTRASAVEWAKGASREDVYTFLRDTVHKLEAIEGSPHFTEDEQGASDSVRDAAEMLRDVLKNEFATTL